MPSLFRFSQVTCMLMTKDKSTLITGDTGGSVIVWDMSSGERKSTLKADGEVRCFASCGGALWCVDCGCGAVVERVGLALWSPILRQAGRRSASACACCRVCGWWCAFAMVGSCVVCVVCCLLWLSCGVCVVALRGGMAMGTGWERAVCTWLRFVVACWRFRGDLQSGRTCV